MSNVIRGAGGPKPSQPRTPVEAPDSLRSIAYAQILDLISEGEIIGFADQVHPMRCYYLDGTPVENADGTKNFINLQIESRVGTQTQDYIKGFDSVENEIGINVPLLATAPWSRSVTNLNLSAVRVTLSVPALSSTNLTNGDISGYKIDYKIEIATDGGSFVQLLSTSFNGKTTSKYQRSHRIDLPPAVTTGWVIRVTRLTFDSQKSEIQDTTTVDSFTEIIDAKLRMPMTAVVSLTIDASQFNNIPSRAFRMKGRIIKIPSNYNPTTRVYTGIWDGTFQTQYSNNPAWVFYDMAINDRYGLGHIIPAALIDKWALYKIAVYCDGSVSDGKGGMEPRFTSNVYLQSQEDAYRVMMNLATVFRGIMYASNGSITAVGDMPEDPSYIYTRANVIDGKFVYSGSSRKVRHTVALVSWSDMNDFGRAKVEYIEDEAGIARYGVQQTEVIALGSTSQGQARRLGKYILATERYETDTVAFGVGLDGTLVAPGKVVHIADPLRAGRRIGGRIASYAAGVVVIDKADLLAIGDTFIATLPSGLPEERSVTGVAGNTITLASGFSVAPEPQSVWAVRNVSLDTQRFRILGVAKSGGDTLGYTVNAVEHVAGKFDFVELDLKIVEPSISAGAVLQPPTSLTLTSYERTVGAVPVLVLVATWPEIVGVKEYEFAYRRNNGTWSSPVKTTTNRCEVESAAPGTYLGRVATVGANGFTSSSRFSTPTVIEPFSFTRVLDLVSLAGVLTIDCSLSEQYLLVLTQNITSVVFINVASQKTLIIEIRNPASYTVAWPASVIPVSGIAYVVSTGGTVLVPKIDTIGLNTDTAGVLWALRVDKDDAPSIGGGGGSLNITISPNPAYGYAAGSPSVSIATTVVGATMPITVQWNRAPGGVGDWGGSTGNVGGGNFACSTPNGLNPTFSRTGTHAGYVAQNWRVLVTDAAGLTAQEIFEVTLEDDGVISGGGGGIQCVMSTAYLADGRQAKYAKTGTRTLAVDPFTLEHRLVEITYSQTAYAQCYLLRTEDGVELSCSDTAPIPTRDGRLVLAPAMLGLETITLKYGLKAWSRVVSVEPLGVQEVQHITCENSCFFAGNKKGECMAHHNIKWEPGSPQTGYP